MKWRKRKRKKEREMTKRKIKECGTKQMISR
jgi:hypothetical protein